MSTHRRLLVVLVTALALLAPTTAATAGGGLTVKAAKQLARQYAAEICASQEPQCTGFKITSCARLGAKKVRCKTRLDQRKNETCRYKLTVVKKPSGRIEGSVGKISCS